MSATTDLARVANIARGLDDRAKNLPFRPSPDHHLSTLRRAYLRDGWDAMKAEATKLAREYQAADDARLAALNAALNTPRYPAATPVADVVTRPGLLARAMQWVRKCFVSPQPA